MKTCLTVIGAVAAAAALAACGDREQTLKSGVVTDTASFQGTGKAYAVQGWKQGDKASWEQQVKTRTQNTQNEYTKVP
jgi:hypothetical protein